MGNLPRADKDLGQHFLKDKNVISKITEDFKDRAEIIIEVGPGPAILSRALASHGIPYYFIEKDERFHEQLDTFVEPEFQNFTDALKFDWEDFLIEKNLKGKKIWLVSNLPYNISSPLYISFMKVPEIQFMTLMFQKEVGEKTYIRQNEKNQMGSLLSLSLNYFECKQLMKVHPGAFNPPPKVESIVVSYTRYQSPIVSLEEFKLYETFLRGLFQLKRKQIGSVLKSVIAKDHKEAFFQKSGVDPQVRAESLELDQVYALYNAFKEIK